MIFRKVDREIDDAMILVTYNFIFGASSSGKTTGFESVIRRFESFRPS